MSERIVLVDFAGTLIKASMIEEANAYRSEALRRAYPSKEEHGHSETLYKNNREAVEKTLGLKADMEISYRTNTGEIIKLTGEQYQNQIATDLFSIGMFKVAHKYGEKIVQEGLIQELQRIRACGFKLAIVSGVRNDIISGMLEIAQIPVAFDYILGQPPILGISNEDNIAELMKKGSVDFALGDKMSDLEAGKACGAATIYVNWGHPTGGEEEYADNTISDPAELENIIQ